MIQTALSSTIPDFPIPNGYANNDDYLEKLVTDGAYVHYTDITKPVQERINRELSIVRDAGFANYYLIVHDILQAARSRGIFIGPGRGNAAGSMVHYCLNIIATDPLQHGLLFERVLHPELNAIPDIDIDADEEGRGKIIDYTNERFNGKVLITQYDEVHPEVTGVLQLDILGKKALSVLKRCQQLIGKHHQSDFNCKQIPLNDSKTYKLFQSGDTGGIPFFEHASMQGYLKELKPETYQQLMAIYALDKSGQQQHIDAYIHQKKQNEPLAYDLPFLEHTLGETSGELIYQEQIMILAQLLAGFSPGEADLLRRALQKPKNAPLRPGFRAKFLEGGSARKHNKNVLLKIWEEWETKGEYLFNKSHAVSFVLISWWTAYIKCHYPDEYTMATI